MLVVACLAIGLASASSEVQEVQDLADADPSPALKTAMDKAGDRAAKLAVSEAKAEAAQAAQAAPDSRGIPKEVIDALKRENLVLAIRKVLEMRATAQPSNAKKQDADQAEDSKTDAALTKKITEATREAMADDTVNKAASDAASQVVSEKVKQLEAKSMMEKKIDESLKKSVHVAELNAIHKARAVVDKAVAQESLLASVAGELQDPQSRKASKAKMLQAQQLANKASAFVNSDHKSHEALLVAQEEAKVTQKEDAALVAKLAPTANAEMKAKLANNVAGEAMRKMQLQLDEIRKKATEKVQKEEARAEERDKAKTAGAAEVERGFFTKAVALSKVQGYWSRRRRFAAEKQFVQHGSLAEASGKSKTQQAADKKAAEELVKKQAAAEKKRRSAMRSARIDEEMKKLMAPGKVEEMIRKLAVKSATGEADSISDAVDMKAETAAVQKAVDAVANEAVANTTKVAGKA